MIKTIICIMAAACATFFATQFFPVLNTSSLAVEGYRVQYLWIVFALTTVACYKML